MKQIAYILVIIFCVSCTSRTIYKKPKDLISKEQMIDLWTDIYIANSAKTVKNTALNRKVNYMPFVYQKYNIDSARFMSSNIYYTSRIEEYEKMFLEVEKRIQSIKNIYDPESADIDPSLPIYVRDSIKRSRRLLKEKKDTTNLNARKRLRELQSKENIDLDEVKSTKLLEQDSIN